MGCALESPWNIFDVVNTQQKEARVIQNPGPCCEGRDT